VTLLIGEQATYRGERQARKVEMFTTTSDLRERLKKLSGEATDAVFHAAAVSDFTFGKVWKRTEDGALSELKSGKIPTGAGTLLAELVPTGKIIAELRGWFPRARLTGWKYEVEGGRASAVALGERQMVDCRTDACVVNGRAYGEGFGLVTGPGRCLHLPDAAALYAALEG
jgi:phosphopantothenoylcysteine decarboxylase/phosphopantothenate--cysteine ligase